MASRPTFSELVAQLSSQHESVLQRNEVLAAELAKLRRLINYCEPEATPWLSSFSEDKQSAFITSPFASEGGSVKRATVASTLTPKHSATMHYQGASATSIVASVGGIDENTAAAHSSLVRCSERQSEKLAWVDPRTDPMLKSWQKIRSSTSIGGDKWLINPENSSFLRRWDALALAALVFVAVVTPVQVSILEPAIDWIFVVSIGVDSVFFIDLILQFFIMYPARTDYGTTMVSDFHKVVIHYLQTWFTVDLLSVIPFDILGLIAGGSKLKLVKMVRLLRLIKLTRMLRMSRIVRRLEMRMSITYSRLALMKFFAVLAALTHWLSNLWALTLVIVDADEGVPRWIDSFAELEENISTPTKDTPWKMYVTCLYFTSYTLTSVGYGDIGPVNIIERMACTFMIIVAGIAWAVVLGQVGDVVATMNSDEQAFQRQMDELSLMSTDHDLPTHIRQRLRHFFMSSKVVERQRARRRNLMKAMSSGLKVEVALELNRAWLRKVSVLQQLLCTRSGTPLARHNNVFIAEVCLSMATEVYAQAEAVGKPQTLFVVGVGLVCQGMHLLKAGMVWGSDFVLSCPSHQKNYGAAAVTYVELSVLRRADFMTVLDAHRVACPEIALHVRRFCCWCAFQCEILREAKRRRRRRTLQVSILTSARVSADGLPTECGGGVAASL